MEPHLFYKKELTPQDYPSFIARLLFERTDTLRAELTANPDFKRQLLAAIAQPIPKISDHFCALRDRVKLLVEESEIPLWLNPFMLVESLTPPPEALFEAIGRQDLQEVTHLIDLFGSRLADLRFPGKMTPLHLAAVAPKPSLELICLLAAAHPEWIWTLDDNGALFLEGVEEEDVLNKTLPFIFPKSIHHQLGYLICFKDPERAMHFAEHNQLLLDPKTSPEKWTQLRSLIEFTLSKDKKELAVRLLALFDKVWYDFPTGALAAWISADLLSGVQESALDKT